MAGRAGHPLRERRCCWCVPTRLRDRANLGKSGSAPRLPSTQPVPPPLSAAEKRAAPSCPCGSSHRGTPCPVAVLPLHSRPRRLQQSSPDCWTMMTSLSKVFENSPASGTPLGGVFPPAEALCVSFSGEAATGSIGHGGQVPSRRGSGRPWCLYSLQPRGARADVGGGLGHLRGVRRGNRTQQCPRPARHS